LPARSPSTIPTNRGGRSNKRIVATINRAARACLEPPTPAKTTRLVRFTLRLAGMTGIHLLSPIESDLLRFTVLPTRFLWQNHLDREHSRHDCRGSSVLSAWSLLRREVQGSSNQREAKTMGIEQLRQEQLVRDLASLRGQNSRACYPNRRCVAGQRNASHNCCSCVEGLLT
jgi:hypothetical protein